jgi:chromosome segregation ATPase
MLTHAQSEQPVLPDSYLRSPHGKGAATNSYAPQPHQPGAIVRIHMTDFVTYSDVEFAPGPNLNMIIGPNGTGKSTLVCAICLGLGWETKHLGRAKDISDYVKHGAKRAIIEIELARDPKKQRNNPVIKTRIQKDGNKVEYWIDGKKENKKRVMDLARSYSIQVDNLCQFLPQDRVVEFAALSPVELLAQTQRAAAPEQMTEWHQQLKDMRKEQKTSEDSQSRLTEDLQRLENRQRMQQGDVERLRERSELQERLAAYKKFRPFPAYKVAKQRHTEAKQRRKEAEREFKRLERQMEPNLRAVNAKQEYLTSVDKIVARKKRLVDNMDTTSKQALHALESTSGDIEKVAKELESAKTGVKKTKQTIPEHNRNINSIKTAMKDPPAPVDTAAMNEEIRGKTRQIREVEEKVTELRDQIGTLNQQGKQRMTIVRDAENEKTQLQSQAGQQASKLAHASRNGDAATAWKWIQENKDKFKGEVFGPPILECSIKDSRLAAAAETMITQSELLAFSVTCKEDFTTLQNQLYSRMKLSDINIRSAPAVELSSFNPPCSTEQLRSYGLEGWIIDLLEGPDEVLAMLCDNRAIHTMAYTSRDVPGDQHDNLSKSPISSWVTNTQSYQVTRRREYGDYATSTRVTALRPARFFTDAPVDHRAEEALSRKISETEVEMEEIKEQMTNMRAEEKQLQQQMREIGAEQKAIQEDKNQKQRELAQFQGLQVKLDAAERKLKDAQDQIHKNRGHQRDLEDKEEKLALKKGQQSLDYANSVEALRGMYVMLFEAEIMKIEAKSDLDQLQSRHEAERAQLDEARAVVQEQAQITAALLSEGQRLQQECMNTHAEDATERELEVLEEVKVMDPDELETNIQSTEARLEMTAGGNAGIIAEYEDRAKKIERDRGRLTGLVDTLQQLQSQIEEIKGQWEPRLDALVSEISEAFAENFAKIQCAGEVGVHKDEDFEQWAIQIRVKFR